MNKLKELVFEPTKHNAHTHLALGRLMSPVEVEAATHHRDICETETYRNRWMLCGDLKPATFDLFSRLPGNHIPFRVSGFVSTSGNRWGVITHQVEGHQHRFVLPLWESQTADFVRAMPSAGFGFSLGCTGGSKALLITGQRIQDAAPLLHLCKTAIAPEMTVWMKELPMLMSTLGRAEAIPSIVPKHQVLEVSLSTVMPALEPVPAVADTVLH